MISPGNRLQIKTTKSFNPNEEYPADAKRVVVLSMECKWKKGELREDVKVWTAMTILSH
jgi:hypothetical protein